MLTSRIISNFAAKLRNQRKYFSSAIMIRDFWVKNFLSIRNKQGLDFIAKGPESELIAEVQKGVFLYKLGILYGANASGKSNMLIALNNVFRLLIIPNDDAIEPIRNYCPFQLTQNEPTEMHISFYANGIRYDYDVTYNGRYILSEKLNYYPNNSKSLFYERMFVGDNVQADIKFGPSLKLSSKTQERICENTLNNHSVLAVSNKIALNDDFAPFNILRDWILNNYHDVDKVSSKGLVETLKTVYFDPRKHKFYNTMLQKADLNILDFRPSVVDRYISNDLREHLMKSETLPANVKEQLLKPTEETISFVNKTDNGNFEIPLGLQSKGTLKFIQILDSLYDLVSGEHVYYLDELGEDLHYDLLYYYLNVFLYNSEQSQLIITSQETSLLSQDLINENRGAVWFVEKNRDTASSEYSRGDSFGLHKNLSFYNSYRIGKLGAKPELGSFFVDFED